MDRHGASESRWAYRTTWCMLALAFGFPIALMILNPTLMFKRGWEQYVGTAIYVWAIVALARELRRLSRDETGFADAPRLLARLEKEADAAGEDADDPRTLTNRLRQLARHGDGRARPSVPQLIELNREGSALDSEHASGRFTITKYILYLLPVIGFIGTVEGISKALMNISRVLPMVKDLDGFLNNLTSVTSALQIAFDSTLLALFLSAALMLAQTLVYRRAEDLLARIDRWIVEFALPALGASEEVLAGGSALPETLDSLRRELATLGERLGAGLGPHVADFGEAIDRMSQSFDHLDRGADALGRLGDDLSAIGRADETLRRGASTLARIETALVESAGNRSELEEIRRGVDRTCQAVEGLSIQWAQAFERTSRVNQEQLARALGGLKDALELLQVSMEQSNALYRNIVKKINPTVYPGLAATDDQAA